MTGTWVVARPHNLVRAFGIWHLEFGDRGSGVRGRESDFFRAVSPPRGVWADRILVDAFESRGNFRECVRSLFFFFSPREGLFVPRIITEVFPALTVVCGQ